MSGPSAAGMPPQIQTDWRVQLQPQPSQPRIVLPQPGELLPPPQVYGPVQDSSRVGSYARDDFDQHRFPDPDGSNFAEQPLGDRIKDKVEEIAGDHPVAAAALVGGAFAAIGEGKVKVERDVSIGGVRGSLEVRAEVDQHEHRYDPATGIRFDAGKQVSGGLTFRVPFGAPRD